MKDNFNSDTGLWSEEPYNPEEEAVDNELAGDSEDVTPKPEL